MSLTPTVSSRIEGAGDAESTINNSSSAEIVAADASRAEV